MRSKQNSECGSLCSAIVFLFTSSFFPLKCLPVYVSSPGHCLLGWIDSVQSCQVSCGTEMRVVPLGLGLQLQWPWERLQEGRMGWRWGWGGVAGNSSEMSLAQALTSCVLSS